jgi:hypothetical protein
MRAQAWTDAAEDWAAKRGHTRLVFGILNLKRRLGLRYERT